MYERTFDLIEHNRSLLPLEPRRIGVGLHNLEVGVDAAGFQGPPPRQP